MRRGFAKLEEKNQLVFFSILLFTCIHFFYIYLLDIHHYFVLESI